MAVADLARFKSKECVTACLKQGRFKDLIVVDKLETFRENVWQCKPCDAERESDLYCAKAVALWD